jgi:predicted dehydrogenase
MTASRKLRWGILGVAHIINRVLPSFGRSALADLRAIASRDLGKAVAATKEKGIPKAHGSYEALLADPEIDVVYIPLPNTLHEEWTRKAADAGKHILCEKPLTPDAEKARAVVDHCKARGVKLMDGFMWPHHPRTTRVRQYIDGGGIGEVLRVNGAFSFLLKPMDPANIRLQPGLAGGCLLDVGCYPAYAIRWAFGAEPVRAWATARYLHGVEVELSGTVSLADGRVAAFDCGFTQPYRGWLEIIGSEGVITLPQMWLPDPEATWFVSRDDKSRQTLSVPGHDQVACMFDNFSRAILNDEPVRPDPEEAVRTLRVLDALARSAREGHEVAV